MIFLYISLLNSKPMYYLCIAFENMILSVRGRMDQLVLLKIEHYNQMS